LFCTDRDLWSIGRLAAISITVDETLLFFAIRVLPPFCIEADNGTIFGKNPESHDRKDGLYKLFAHSHEHRTARS